jgi:hypothetical protein
VNCFQKTQCYRSVLAVKHEQNNQNQFLLKLLRCVL